MAYLAPAELTKYAANAMLATKISFMNEGKALVRTAQQADYVPELLQAVEAVNQFQKQRLNGLNSSHFGGAKDLAGRRFALWGLAFKPNTDDMRDAPAWPPTTPKRPMPW